MDLEEHTLERAGDRCEECGAKLTEREMAVVLETGGPTLCSIHAAEVRPPDAASPTRPARLPGGVGTRGATSTILPSLPPAAKRS